MFVGWRVVAEKHMFRVGVTAVAEFERLRLVSEQVWPGEGLLLQH